MTASASRSALVSWTLTEAPAGAGATKAEARGRAARAAMSFCGGAGAGEFLCAMVRANGVCCDCKFVCVWSSNLGGRRRRTAIEASLSNGTCALRRHV